MGSSKMVEIEGWEFKTRTDRAVLVSDGDVSVWIPLSLIEELEGIVGEELDEEIMQLETFTVPLWVAIQKGLV